MRIGNIIIKTPIVLGPMAGVTDLPFRVLCHEQGAGLVYTEMVSAKAVLYRNRNTFELMKIDPSEHPVSLQLFGNDPDVMAEAAAAIEDIPFDILDINMGCPVPKVVNNGEGSALMRDTERAAAIVDAVVKKIKKPVTVKIRSGFDGSHINAAEFAKRLEAAGASAVAVHGRTREQYYSGKADWEIIRRVKEAVSIPVIGNGDADSPDNAKRLIEATGADAVMIARGARGNPWIFSRTKGLLCGGDMPSGPDSAEVISMVFRHMDMMMRYKGEYTAVREMRKHIAWYTAGYPHSAEIRRRINEITDPNEMKKLLKIWLTRNARCDRL